MLSIINVASSWERFGEDTPTLKKFVVVLEPEKLTEEERKRLREEEAKASMAIH